MKKRTFILSDQSVNSYMFIVLTSGIILDFFRKNPVMLFNHCPDDIIGKWENIRVEGTQLLADAVFDENDPEAMILYNKVEQGMLNCVSIQFQILEVEYGMPGNEDVPIVTKCSLKEASLTPTPSNENALVLYDKNGQKLSKEQLTVLLSKNKNTDNMKKIQFFVAALTVVGAKLSNEASEDDVLKEVSKLSADHIALTDKFEALSAEKTALTNQIAALKAEKDAEDLKKVDSLVDGAFTAGKLTADKVDQYKKLAKADFDTTKSIIDSMPVRTSLSSIIEDKTKTSDKYSDWGLKKLHREAPEELARIKEQEPERYKSLLTENK